MRWIFFNEVALLICSHRKFFKSSLLIPDCFKISSKVPFGNSFL